MSGRRLVFVVLTIMLAGAACAPTTTPSEPDPVAPDAVLSGPPPAAEYPGIPWTFGQREVPAAVIALIVGPAHCGYASVLLLTLGWPLGRAATTSDQARQYVRDPDGHVVDLTLGTFESSVALPDNAVFTGYRYGDDQLWTSVDTAEEAVFYVRDGVVERWPRAPELLACA
jgi:hypothetical protein